MKTKLAKPARKIRAFHTAARQVRTEYRGGHVGHSRTTQGALRAAVMRIVNGEFTGATIWDEHGRVAYVIKRKGRYTLITQQ